MLAEQLALHEEFAVHQPDTATKAVQHVKGERVDCVVMDVGLPDMDGREAVKSMRKSGFRSPIVMLTGHGGDADTILGLEAGANDYVVKPFKFAVLLARVRAQLRQQTRALAQSPHQFRRRQLRGMAAQVAQDVSERTQAIRRARRQRLQCAHGFRCARHRQVCVLGHFRQLGQRSRTHFALR